MSNTRLSIEEREKLILKHAGKISAKEIADMSGVSDTAIRRMAARMGVCVNLSWAWTPEQDEIIKERYMTSSSESIAKIIGCRPRQVLDRAGYLGLRKYPRQIDPAEISDQPIDYFLRRAI